MARTKTSKGRLKKPWEPSPEQMERYYLVIRGDKSMSELAPELGITHQAISATVRRIDKWLAPQWMDSIRELKSNQTQRLMAMYNEAMQAWFESKKDAVQIKSRLVEEPSDGEGVSDYLKSDGKEIERIVKVQCGNVGYIEQARKCLADIRSIWGADAPVHVEYSGELRVAGMSVEEANQNLINEMDRVRQQLTRPSEN